MPAPPVSVLPKLKDNIMIGASTPIPEDKTLGEMIVDQLKKHGNDVFLVDAATDVSKTFRDVLTETITVAALLQEHGLGVGTTVGVCSENRLEMPVILLATQLVGATVAPLNPLYTTAELNHTLSISQPSVIFCSPFTAAKVNEVRPQCAFIKKLVVFGNDVVTDEKFTSYESLITNKRNPDTYVCPKFDIRTTVATILCSSGTTGLPKGVELTHYNLIAFIEAIQISWDPTADESPCLLGLIPFFHGYGFGMLMFSTIIKMKIAIMSMFNEKLFLSTIQKYRVSVLALVPPLMVFLAKHPLVDQYDLSSLKQIRCGAAPLSKEIQMAVQKRLKCNDVKQGYGMTETTIACVFTPPDRNKVGSGGIVCRNMEAKVIDVETGKALPPYKEGEICFRGPLVMKGYKNNPKANAETIDKDGWLHTGDVGFYDIQGFIYIVDRLKELIKYKGFQVAPAELEAMLLKNPKIKDAAVIGIPDEEAGELPFAYVVKQPDVKITEDEVKKFVADKVSPQKRLTGGVRFIDEIPKNPSGKILRRELRAAHKSKM